MLALLSTQHTWSIKGGSTGPMSDRHSQEGAMDSITEGMEHREGRWRQVLQLTLCASWLNSAFSARASQGPWAPLYPLIQVLTYRDSSPEWIPTLQHHQVQILDCGDQVTTKGQVCKSNGDVKALGGKPEVAKVRWQMTSSAWTYW